MAAIDWATLAKGWGEDARAEHDQEAASALYWYLDQGEVGTWSRYDSSKGELVGVSWKDDHLVPTEPFAVDVLKWRPWHKTLSTDQAPYFQWFCGGRTNACFNAVDKHLVEGRGAELAFTSCPELQEEGQFIAPVSISRRALAVAVALAAERLRDEAQLGIRDRVLFHMQTGIAQMVYLLACMRLGVLYSCTSVDQPLAAIRYRLENIQPDAVVTQSIPTRHGGREMICLDKVKQLLEGETKPVVIVDEVPQDPLLSSSSLPDQELLSQLWRRAGCSALPADHALFVSYSSGSTGKPKGLVHTHGGYVYGVSRTMSAVFEVTPGKDTILTVGTTAWITGQSYMLIGPLVSGVCSVLLEGSPAYPGLLRIAETAQQQRVSILKMGSALMRQVQADQRAAAALAEMEFPHLRMGTFCAEPVTLAVHEFACRTLTPNFINSYWSTEHGGIVFTRSLDLHRPPPQPDTKVFALPWIDAGLAPGDGEASAGLPSPEQQGEGTGSARLGDILVRRPFPSLARTIFGDVANAKSDLWRGDLAHFEQTYFNKDGAFVQGDAALFYPDDGSYTLHGRTDEVINVSGNRVGTEEIEAAIWVAARGAIKACAVVGGPDFVKGLTPVAWVVLTDTPETAEQPGTEQVLSSLVERARQEVLQRLGGHAVPEHLLPVQQLPLTQTGKTARKVLQLLLHGGMASSDALANPQCMEELKAAAQEWRLCGQGEALPHDLSGAWGQYQVQEHVIQGRATFPATAWLLELTRVFGAPQLAKVRLQKALQDEPVELALQKRGSSITVSSGGDMLLSASLEPAGGARVFLPAMQATGGDMATGPRTSLLKAVEEQHEVQGAEQEMELEVVPARAHYRRCDALGLSYSGSYRCVRQVCWDDFDFIAWLQPSKNLAATLDAGMQVLCSYSRTETSIPVGIEAFELRSGVDLEAGPPGPCRVVGRVTCIQRDGLQGDLDFFDADATSEPFARLRCVAVLQIASRMPPQQEVQQREQQLRRQEDDASSTLALAKGEPREAAQLRSEFLQVVQSITASQVELGASLLENGIQSLRITELRHKLEASFGASPSMAQLVNASSLEVVLEELAAAAKRAHADPAGAQPSELRSEGFEHVNFEAVNAIIAKQLAPKPLLQVPEHIEQLPYVVYYILRKGLLTYLRLQFRDGLFAFMRNPPKVLNLGLEVVVPGPYVHFTQTDFNAHFTVREIIRDSERGYYNLVHRNGIAHLEHHFGVMLFCTRLTGDFKRELPVGHQYEMRCRVASVRGPVVDARIAFHDAEGNECYVVTWSLLLVINASKRQMFDFELGRVTDAVQLPKDAATAVEEAAAVAGKRRRWAFAAFLLVMALFLLAFFVVPGGRGAAAAGTAAQPLPEPACAHQPGPAP